MKKTGILNAELSHAIARLGHGHLVVVGDSGLPIPNGPRVIDLALVHGVPTFAQVVEALAADVVFEKALLAQESSGLPPEAIVRAAVSTVDTLTHENLKRLSADAQLFVRTGEATPYANAIFVCGVSF